MAGIKFDQLDPETKKRVLKALEEQAGETKAKAKAEPERGVLAAGGGPETGRLKAEPAQEAAGVKNGVSVGPKEKPYFIVEHPYAFAWLWSVLLWGSGNILFWFFEMRLGSSWLYTGRHWVFGWAPLVLIVGAVCYFYLRQGLRIWPVVLGFPLILACVCLDGITSHIGTIVFTGYALYLYWEFKNNSIAKTKLLPDR